MSVATAKQFGTLDVALLTQAGVALFGPRWKSAMAREIGFGLRALRAVGGGERRISVEHAVRIKHALRKRLDHQKAVLLAGQGRPHDDQDPAVIGRACYGDVWVTAMADATGVSKDSLAQDLVRFPDFEGGRIDLKDFYVPRFTKHLEARIKVVSKALAAMEDATGHVPEDIGRPGGRIAAAPRVLKEGRKLCQTANSPSSGSTPAGSHRTPPTRAIQTASR